jgi:hypothetical protein
MAMTASQWGKVLPVISAFIDGKAIQYLRLGKWMDVSPGAVCTFADPSECYRIKPEPVLRPWTEAEIDEQIIKQVVVRHKSLPTMGPLRRSFCGVIAVAGSDVDDEDMPETLLENYVIAATGAPCGVEE